MYVIKHKLYPELSTFDASGDPVRFSKGILRTNDEDLALSFEGQPGVEIVERQEPKKPARAAKSKPKPEEQ